VLCCARLQICWPQLDWLGWLVFDGCSARLGSLLLVLSRCWRSAASLSVLAAIHGPILDARSLVALGSDRLAALGCARLSWLQLDWLGWRCWLVFSNCSTLGSLLAADRCSFLAGCSALSDRARIAVCADHELIPAGSDRLGSSSALGSPAVRCCSARLAVC